MKEKKYRVMTYVLLIMMTVVIVVNDRNYRTLVKENEEVNELLDSQKEADRDLIDKWKISYQQLQSDYEELFSEKEYLKFKNGSLSESINTVKIPEYSYSSKEVYLLAQCVEAEAGYSETSQKYITQVILNRLENSSFPNTISGVIYQKENGIPQFSTAYDGSMNRSVKSETLSNVYSVLVHGTDLPEYVLYFYSAKVRENWVNSLNTYKTIDGTVFAYK